MLVVGSNPKSGKSCLYHTLYQIIISNGSYLSVARLYLSLSEAVSSLSVILHLSSSTPLQSQHKIYNSYIIITHHLLYS